MLISGYLELRDLLFTCKVVLEEENITNLYFQQLAYKGGSVWFLLMTKGPKLKLVVVISCDLVYCLGLFHNFVSRHTNYIRAIVPND